MIARRHLLGLTCSRRSQPPRSRYLLSPRRVSTVDPKPPGMGVLVRVTRSRRPARRRSPARGNCGGVIRDTLMPGSSKDLPHLFLHPYNETLGTTSAS